MVLHFIDEASKYHTAKIVREGTVSKYSDLGNVMPQISYQLVPNGHGIVNILIASMLMNKDVFI